MALDSSGFPVVSYYNRSDGGELRVLHCGDATCSSGNSIETPDNSEDNVGQFTSLVLHDDHPVVSYFDSSHSTLKVLHCDDPLCTGGDESIESPDTSGDSVGQYTSLALHGDHPVVSYFDSSVGVRFTQYRAPSIPGEFTSAGQTRISSAISYP